MGANTRRGGGHNSSIVFNCATSGILEELIFLGWQILKRGLEYCVKYWRIVVVLSIEYC